MQVPATESLAMSRTKGFLNGCPKKAGKSSMSACSCAVAGLREQWTTRPLAVPHGRLFLIVRFAWRHVRQ